MKKYLALLLALIVTVSLFAGCGGNEIKTQSGDENNETTGSGSVDTGDLTYIGDEPVTLTIGVPQSPLVEDYYDNYYTKWMEEQTGFTLEFKYFAASSTDYKTTISTMATSKLEMPDILYGFDLGQTTYERYGEDGVFIDLRPYFDDKEGASKVWWERFEQLSESAQTNNWRRMVSSDGSGAIYAFPEIQDSLIDITDSQVWINQEWLDTLGLEKPTDPDSLYTVLKAFKEKDPNGNGLADEIPLIGTNASLAGDTIGWLINMFIYYDSSVSQFNVDEDGQLYLVPTTDQYREALKYINKLYSEGLMNPLTLRATSNDLTQLVCPSEGNPALAGIVVGHITLVFEQKHEGLLAYEALPLWGNAIFNENTNNRTTFITSSCKNPNAAFQFLMASSSYESSIIQRYGEEGVSWDWAPEGSESVIGEHREAEIRLYQDTWGTIGNDNWRNVEATILFNAEGEGNQSVPEEETEVNLHKYRLFNDMLESYYYQEDNYNPDDSLICPLLVWSQELKDELPNASSDCNNVISTYRTEFIMGTKDINDDSAWQAYIDKLAASGSEDWLYYSQYIYEQTIAGTWIFNQ